MDYRSVYNSIIRRGLERKDLIEYSEIHHIIPKALGGSDEQDNLVVLSAREHFICHLLLTKIYKEGSVEWIKMMVAFNKMWSMNGLQNRYCPSKWYSYAKSNFSKAQSINQSGNGNSQFGKRWIINPTSQEVRKIKESDLEKYLKNGWLRGRTLNPKYYRKLTEDEKTRKKLQRAEARNKDLEVLGKKFRVKNKKTGEKCYLHEYDIKKSEDLWESNYRDIDEKVVIEMLSNGTTLGKIAEYYNLSYYAFYEWYRKHKDRIKSFVHKNKKLCPICGIVLTKSDRKYCSKECYYIAAKQMHWIRKDHYLKRCINKELSTYISDGWVEVVPVGTKPASEWKIKLMENVE